MISTRSVRFLVAAVTCLGFFQPVMAQNANGSTYFNVTAITAINGSSVLQCWQLSNPITTTSLFGTAGISVLQFGNTTNFTYTAYPAKTDLGPHNAPSVQWVVALNGLVHVTLPNTTAGPETEAWYQGGAYGFTFAADTADISQYGHITSFPGDSETILLFIPVADNKIPDHQVLYTGACKWSELAGI